MKTRFSAVAVAAGCANFLFICGIMASPASAADWGRPEGRPAGVSTLAAMDLQTPGEAKPAARTAGTTTHIVLPAITTRPAREIAITPSISNSPADSYADCMPGAFRQIR